MSESEQHSAPPDNATHILIVDDDHRIRNLLAKYLNDNGFRVTSAADSAAATAAMRGLAFDLFILDVMMPGENGLALAARLRRATTAPILMITAQTGPDERVRGLEIGVDDYISKPFEPRELLLRINNVLKRRSVTIAERDEVKMGLFVFHLARGELRRGDETIKLTERERELMRQFALRAGTPIPRHELVTGDATASERAIDVQINRLRRKIEQDPANPVYLQTVRGRGYILHTE